MPKSQRGGHGFHFADVYHPHIVTNLHHVNAYTMDHLDASPMFNPLAYDAIVTTPIMGSHHYLVGGENKDEKANKWINHVKQYAEKTGMTYKQALSHKECRQEYYTLKK